MIRHVIVVHYLSPPSYLEIYRKQTTSNFNFNRKCNRTVTKTAKQVMESKKCRDDNNSLTSHYTPLFSYLPYNTHDIFIEIGLTTSVYFNFQVIHDL